jgi:hypothetical protein
LEELSQQPFATSGCRGLGHWLTAILFDHLKGSQGLVAAQLKQYLIRADEIAARDAFGASQSTIPPNSTQFGLTDYSLPQTVPSVDHSRRPSDPIPLADDLCLRSVSIERTSTRSLFCDNAIQIFLHSVD